MGKSLLQEDQLDNTHSCSPSTGTSWCCRSTWCGRFAADAQKRTVGVDEIPADWMGPHGPRSSSFSGILAEARTVF